MSNLSHSGVKRGFTLIELLVVISIIALLLAILMPSLRRARESAYYAVCSANLKQFHLGFMFYANDNNDQTIPGLEWTTGLGKVIPKVKPSVCPYSREVMDTRKVIDSYFNSPKSWKCPGDARGVVFDNFNGSSYGYDWYILSRKYSSNAGNWGPKDVTSYKLSRFDRPAETTVFFHQWIYDGSLPIDYEEGLGIYWPHKHLRGKKSTGCFHINLDASISPKVTYGESQQKGYEISSYYIKRYPAY